MEFSRQEHWSVLPCPSPGDIVNSRSHMLGILLIYITLITPVLGTPVILTDIFQPVLSLPRGCLILTSLSGILFSHISCPSKTCFIPEGF